jgi:hypothetical protein
MRAALGLWLLLVTAAAAEPYAVGDLLESFSIEDQHAQPAAIDATVRIVLVTRDMDAGGLVREALGEREQVFLNQRHAVYLADISAMPVLVSKLMALPRMRRRSYRVLVDRDGVRAGAFPYEKGKVTLVRLDGLRITAIEHLTTAADVGAALER